MTINLNDNDLIPSVDLREVNFDAWVERYRNAPSITPDGIKPAGGSGFIDPAAYEHDPVGLSACLNNRRSELDSAIGPDKERLGLLYKAEQAHALRSGYSTESWVPSPGEERDAMAKLMQYDHDHGHPIADSRRDLNKEPYTAKEQSDWHRRDGRQLTSQELEVSHQLDWDSMATQRQPSTPKPAEGWHIHAAVKPEVDREHARRAQEQKLAQELSQGAQMNVNALSASDIRARRGIAP
ncbi:hypothetical protein [Pseudoxanthomonas mexicana]